MNWVKGHIPDRDDPLFIKDSNCDVKTEDGQYVIVASFSEDINEQQQKVQLFLNNFPRLNDTELLTAPDGIYNWLIYEANNDPELKFVATPVLSPYELGTLHKSIANDTRLRVKRIFGAGELKKKGSSITFNTESGTYMGYPKENMTHNEGINYEAHVQDVFKTFLDRAIYTTTEFVKNITVVPRFILDFYKDIGCIVLLFPTRKQCLKVDSNIDLLTSQLDILEKPKLKHKHTIKNNIESITDKLSNIYKTSIHSPNNLTIRKSIKSRTRKSPERIQKIFLRAAEEGNLEYILDALKLNIVDMNEKDAKGNTALILAANKGHIPIVRELISKGANMNIQNNRGHTALILAIYHNYIDIANLLIDRGADTNIRTNTGNTALIQACDNGQPRMLKTVYNLLLKKADPNARDKSGKTPLMLCANEYPLFIELLLRFGADVDTQNNNGKTALTYAVELNNKNNVHLLVDAGADIYLVDNNGLSPYSRALLYNDYDIIQILLKNQNDSENTTTNTSSKENTNTNTSSKKQRRSSKTYRRYRNRSNRFTRVYR